MRFLPFRRSLPLSSKVFAVLAVVLGAAAFLVVRAERQRYEALRPVVGPPVTVVFSEVDLPRGSVLQAASLTTREVPQAFVPPGALPSVERAAGRVLSADVAAGEAVTTTRLATDGVGPLAALVPPGLRAVGITAPVPAGLRPGDRIDLMATYGGGSVYTDTVGVALEILQIAPTRSAGITGSTAGDASPTLIVLATPDVAERLATASSFATLHVSVVGPDEQPGGSGSVPSAAPDSG